MNTLSKKIARDKSNQKGKESQAPKQSTGGSCYRCLGDYEQASCPFKNVKCRYCKKGGHIQQACRNRIKETQGLCPPVNRIDDSGDDSDDFLENLEVHNVGNKEGVIWVNPVVEGKTLKSELDAGSALSVILGKQYKNFGQLKLEESPVVLKTYTGKR